MTRDTRWIVPVLALMSLAACAGNDSSVSDSSASLSSRDVDPAPAQPENGANPLGGNSPEDQLMPSLVCMNLQEAQDEIQDHGVFLSRSEDATGQDRMQINDSNWLVVAQDPAAGTAIGEGDAVLYVVKYDDDYPTPC